MKKRMRYICEMCGTGYPTKEEAEGCEASHEKNVKVNKFEYVYNVEMPKYVYVENADGTIEARYNLIGIRDSRNTGKN
jgi:hypothetical protein|nr:MAG TPA: C2H2 type zinc-finger protein [Caudoviricetes sp.]DAT56026.1 MAG TPA: C2H2 type zinc-finger protein [Caudoviricetes sp.]